MCFPLQSVKKKPVFSERLEDDPDRPVVSCTAGADTFPFFKMGQVSFAHKLRVSNELILSVRLHTVQAYNHFKV